MADKVGNICIENAELMFTNFSGRQTKFNPRGLREFNVVLEPEMAERLMADGWNVRYLNPREEGDPAKALLNVRVNLDSDTSRPAEIYIIGDGRKHRVFEDQVHMLDEMEFENIDLVIRPYIWDVNGKSGIKAYLKCLYATGLKDVISSKYLNIPNADE